MGSLLEQYKSSPLYQDLSSRLGDLVTEPKATGQDRKAALDAIDTEKEQRFGPTEQDWPDQDLFEQAVAGTKQKRKLDALVKQRQGTFSTVQQARETEAQLHPPGPSLYQQSVDLMQRLFGDETALSQERTPTPITPEPIARDLVRGTTPTLAPKVPLPQPLQSSAAPAADLDPLIERYAKEFNVPAPLVRAVIRQESNFDPRAVSKMGAKGLMQLMDATASELGVDDPFDAEQNIKGGTHYLSTLLKRYGGDRDRALAAYNFGMGNVEAGLPLPKETKQYIQNVTRFAGDTRFAKSPQIIQPTAQVAEASILPTDLFGGPSPAQPVPSPEPTTPPLLMPGMEGVGDKIATHQETASAMPPTMPLPEGTTPQVARMLAPTDMLPQPLARYESGPIERSTARKLTGGLEAAGRGLFFGGPTKFFDWLDAKAHQLGKATGLQTGGLFKDLADLSRAKAENKPVDQTLVENIIERIAEAPSNDIPKIAAFTHTLGPVLGFAGLGLVEGAEKGTKEAIIEGIKGALTGRAFQGLEGLGLVPRMLGGGTLGVAQSAAEGVTDPAELLASGVTMAALSAPGPIKGETFGERLGGYRAKPQVSKGNPFDALGVDANTATLADVTTAFKEKANELQRTTFNATTDAERHASIDAFQKLTKDFREAESILGKERIQRPPLDPGSVGEVQKLLPEPPLQAGSADALAKLKPLTPEQLVSDIPETLSTKKGEKPSLIKKPVDPLDVYDPTVRPPVPAPSAEADALAKVGTSAGIQRRAEPPKPETLLPEELSVRPMGQRQLIKKKPVEVAPSEIRNVADPEADALAKVRPSNKPATPQDVTPTTTTELTAKDAKASVPETLTTKTGPPTVTRKEVSVQQLQDLARQKQVGDILGAISQQMTGKPRLEVLSPSERKIVAKRLEEMPAPPEATSERAVDSQKPTDATPEGIASLEGKNQEASKTGANYSEIIPKPEPPELAPGAAPESRVVKPANNISKEKPIPKPVAITPDMREALEATNGPIRETNATASETKPPKAETTGAVVETQKPSPMRSYEMDTEDAGTIPVRVKRHKDGSVSIIDLGGNGVNTEYPAAFTKDKSDQELLQYTYEPIGFRGAVETGTTVGQKEGRFEQDDQGMNRATRELRSLAHDKEAPGDVSLANGRYVSLDDAVRLAREGIESGKIRPFPFQLNNMLDLAMRDANRVLELATKSGKISDMSPTAMSETPASIDTASHEAATSPKNDLAEPTKAQKEVGNYKKGHVTIGGLPISIENPQGSTRSGTDAKGKPWSVEMKSHYGYLKGTTGRDKDHLDVFVKPGTPEDYSGPVYVIDQKSPATDRFDEHKIILGSASLAEAKQLYHENYAKNWKGLQSVKAFTMDEFKQWLKTGNHQRPAIEAKSGEADTFLSGEPGSRAALPKIKEPGTAETATPPAAPRTSKSGYQSKGFSSDRDLKEETPATTETPRPAEEATDFQAKASNRPVPSKPRIPVAPITGKEAKPITEIMMDVSKGTGQKLTTAKLPAGAAGTYYPGSAATTIKYSGNLDATAHELAHSLDDKFGIVADWAQHQTSPYDAELQPFAEHGSIETTGPRSSPMYVRAEGVAEWLRAWLVNPKAAEAAAPQFAKHALGKLDAPTLKTLTQFSTDIREFAGSTAHGKIMANVQWEAPETKLTDWITGGKAKNGPGFKLTWADTAKAELTDRLQPYMKAIDYARQQRGLTEAPLPMHDPSLLARLYMGIHAKMDQVFEKGMIDARWNHVTKGGLDWLMEPLDKKALDAEMKEVASYMIAQRTLEKAEQLGKGRVSGIGAGIESDVAVAQQRILDLKTQDPKKLARIEEAAGRYREWADANLKYLLDKGRISVEQYDGIKANNEYYVAMQRILEVAPGEELVTMVPKGAGGSKLGSAKQPIQSFHGSTKTIKNPYSSLMDATYKAVREADRNDVLKHFRDLLVSDRKMYEGQQQDLASVGRLAKPGEKETIPIFVNGEKEIWQFNPEVYKALKAVDDTAMQLPKFLEVLTYPERIMRAGIVNMPPFQLRNIIRDAFQRVVLSNSGSKPYDSLKIYSKAEKEAFAKAGGDQAGYYYRDDADYQQAMKRTMKDLMHQGQTIVLDPAKLARGYSNILEAGERQGRLSEYRRAFEKAKTELGYDDYNASLYAAGQARELLDFAIAGNTVRVINRFVPFTNAAIQGLRIAGKRVAANPVGVGARWFAWVAAPTLLAYLWNQSHGDIDEYRQLPAYQRDLFWNMKLGDDTWLAIPKPFELGAMATTIERMTDKAMGNDQAFEGHWRSLANSLLPVDEQALFGPLQSVGSAIANYDFFRDKSIVPRHEENLDLNLRRTDRASRLGQVIQEAIGVDARKIDFVVEGQLGYLGKYATGLSDIGRKNRPGINASATGVLKPSPVDAALDVKWVHDKAVERGALSTKEWKQFQEIKNAYHKAEGREAREAMGVKVRAAAKKLRHQWERKPPRPDAEKKLKRKRLLEGYPDPVLETMGVQD